MTGRDRLGRLGVAVLLQIHEDLQLLFFSLSPRYRLLNKPRTWGKVGALVNPRTKFSLHSTDAIRDTEIGMRDGLAKEMATQLEQLANRSLADVSEELPMLQEENIKLKKATSVTPQIY